MPYCNSVFPGEVKMKMAHTAFVDRKEKYADKAWLTVIGILLLLGATTLVSQYKPEWLNFMWLSIATISAAAFAGWIIGFLLDLMFDEVD